MAQKHIEDLSKVLFEGETAVVDIKTMPGTDLNVDPDTVALSLWQSMMRVGLIADGKLVHKNTD